MSSALSHYRANGCSSELVVRVNGVESGMMVHDLDTVLSGSGQEGGGVVNRRPDAIMLPKCDSVEHLQQVCFYFCIHFYCSHFNFLNIFN